MTSDQAQQFWDAFRNAPKQVEMPIDQRRQAGEHAEDATSEPRGVMFAPAAEVAESAGGGIRRSRPKPSLDPTASSPPFSWIKLCQRRRLKPTSAATR
jgi:hypothetical protein